MAPGSAALSLKAAAIVSILALLVVPSFGRCGHPPPPPPPPPTPPPPAPLPQTPAPAPGPGPMLSCDSCWMFCQGHCDHIMNEKCKAKCDGCRTPFIENCKARGGSDNDCEKAADRECRIQCSGNFCETAEIDECRNNCSKQCTAPNCSGSRTNL